ncbi:MAG TPA: pilus assembly protein N-terminal domain-containing protein [Candidatus Limnocylindrales bacterium]|nr:pilus assembly protein N-terminal domain-containing protein [Candidatus Limnocylindrales bacterium]
MEPKRPNKERLSWQSAAYVLLVVMACCFAILGAAAQQPPAAQAPSMAQTPPPAPQSVAAPGQEGEQGPESLHIVVGHSLLIRTPSRIKRILTGNPTVVESVMTSPQEVVLTAKQTGGSSLMLWGETGPSRMMDVFADLDVTSLRNTLDQSFPNSGVDVQSQGDKVMLTGVVASPAIAEQMLKMAANFSKEVVNGLQIAQAPRLKQVMLKVRFAEADRGKLTAFGINLFSTGATNTIGTTSTQQFGPTTINTQQQSTGGIVNPLSQFNLSDLLNIFLFRPDINLGATIKALQQKNVLQILAEPNLMAISGQPAHFLAGGEFPYPVVQGVGGGAGFGSVTIQFKPYGVKLEFLGTIQDDNSIRLKVAPEVSSLDYTNSVTISGFTMPAIQTRRAETEIELKDGQSFGIAGLLDQRTTVQLSKVPGIGDIPILGELFKSRNVNRTNSELIVLVTATIVDPVSGVVPNPQPQVDMPIQNLNTGSFDKGLPSPALPSPAKNPGTKQ